MPKNISLNDTYEKNFGWNMKVKPVNQTEPGVSERTIREISDFKKETGKNTWIRDFRLRALRHFLHRQMPKWGGKLDGINFDEIVYYMSGVDKQGETWDDLPENIRRTFEKLGIPEAERKMLGGVGAQFDSEVVYHKVREDLEKQGVIFVDPDEGLQRYPNIFRKWFGTVVPYADNKFAALNSAVFSGGSFVYIPKGVQVSMPLQAYFRINAPKFGQFERTLIIADEGSRVHYIEGCTAPVYSKNSLHSAVVEIVALPGSHVRYTTLQNWSKNVYNLVTKRAYAFENSTVEWVDANMGCLTEDSQVMMNNDVKSIKDIEIGDNVYSIDHNFNVISQRVVAKKKNPSMDVYKLTTVNQREVTGTKTHPFLVLRKSGKSSNISWMRMEEIQVGDSIAIIGKLPDRGESLKIEIGGLEKSKKISIPKKTSEDLMWLLGFYVGDGYLDASGVCFTVPETDKSNKKLKDMVFGQFGLTSTQYGVIVRIDSPGLASFIKKMGLGENTRTKRIPRWVHKLPHSQKLSFIQGYIDADGYVRKGHKEISITSINRNLLEDVKILSISCGMNPTRIGEWVRREKKTLGKESKTYRHYFLCFGESIPPTNILFTKVSSKEYVGRKVTYDIEVEGTSNFIANGVIVHNSKLTMKYPSVFMKGRGARADILSVAFAGKDQHQDTGAKAMHLAPNTTSRITAKSVSKDGGRSTYRGLLHVAKGASGVKSSVRCDALLLDEESKTDTYPYNDIQNETAVTTHEASVGKIGEEQLFYLMSRGLSETDALNMIVTGFFDAFAKEIPLEYAVEFNRLIQLEMEGAVG